MVYFETTDYTTAPTRPLNRPNRPPSRPHSRPSLKGPSHNLTFRKKPDPHGHCEFDAVTGTVFNCLVGLESANKFACDPRVPNYAKLKGITVEEVAELLRQVSKTSKFAYGLHSNTEL